MWHLWEGSLLWRQQMEFVLVPFQYLLHRPTDDYDGVQTNIHIYAFGFGLFRSWF